MRLIGIQMVVQKRPENGVKKGYDIYIS